jgi:hypothetical protein
MTEVSEITLRLADLEPIQEILSAAGDLARTVDWFLNDMVYTAPEDLERMHRGWQALNVSVLAFKDTVRLSAGERIR